MSVPNQPLGSQGSGSTVLSQDRLREIAWDVGRFYPLPHSDDYIALSMTHPRSGHVHWNIRSESVPAVRQQQGTTFGDASLVVRVYDVTDIIFDGSNAHTSFDLEVNSLTGNYYFKVEALTRNYLAAVGLRSRSGPFHSFARSNPVYFDLDRPSRNYRIESLFVGGALHRTFPVENIFDAPVYERMNHIMGEIQGNGALSIAVVFLHIHPQANHDTPLASLIKKCSRKFKDFGAHVRVFAPKLTDTKQLPAERLMVEIASLSDATAKRLTSAHRYKPFHLFHCHDWYSSAAVLAASKESHVPIVLSLHSTEHERTNGNLSGKLSSMIEIWERRAVHDAALVIVPHETTRARVVEFYGAPAEKVAIIPDALVERSVSARAIPSEVKRGLGLDQAAPMVLFAGEISYATGADLLLEALPTVCRNHGTAQFVFAGNGPLKAELEGRARQAGISHRCRFAGDVPKDSFEDLLLASDFVVIPARVRQEQGLAQAALMCGRPVLTTHQAGIASVVHGENGLVTFDNPGSIVWGIQELLLNPPQGILRVAAKKDAHRIPSPGYIAAQHYMHYGIVLRDLRGSKSA